MVEDADAGKGRPACPSLLAVQHCQGPVWGLAPASGMVGVLRAHGSRAFSSGVVCNIASGMGGSYLTFLLPSLPSSCRVFIRGWGGEARAPPEALQRPVCRRVRLAAAAAAAVGAAAAAQPQARAAAQQRGSAAGGRAQGHASRQVQPRQAPAAQGAGQRRLPAALWHAPRRQVARCPTADKRRSRQPMCGPAGRAGVAQHAPACCRPCLSTLTPRPPPPQQRLMSRRTAP